MSKGDQVRDYMPISKMITKIIEVTSKKEEGIFNICSGKGVRLKDLIKKNYKIKKIKN
jgi:UDP-glucose 4-epimerase